MNLLFKKFVSVV